MGHITSRNHYDKLVARLNRFPQGAPPSETLYKLLSANVNHFFHIYGKQFFH